MTKIDIFWFRRDLRIDDNLNLNLAIQSENLIQPIFIFDDSFNTHLESLKNKKTNFILDCLSELNKKLEHYNSKLIILRGDPKIIIPELSRILNSGKVFVGSDYEPETIKSDLFIASKVNLVSNNDHLLIPPTKIIKDDKTPYRMFTPYLRKWLQVIEPLDYGYYPFKSIDKFANYRKVQEKIINSSLKIYELPKHSNNAFYPASNGHKILQNFLTTKLHKYDHERNFLSSDGTSSLSPYLRYGVISIRECYRLALQDNSSKQWLFELVWRDFYAMILYHFPETTNLEMQPIYRKLNWNRDRELFAKFTEAKTGYPIIDAAILQLTQTGWMHNRARMIVASFLTKNLWLDWRLGEQFFAEHLIDFDQSSNVGGWQWSASTGTDAQPYFRVFNPYLQSKNYDPNGEYIRKYLPQLNNLSNKEIHNPSPLFASKCYWPAIVDYELSRKKAIWNFKNI